jgi:hypothetical protein
VTRSIPRVSTDRRIFFPHDVSVPVATWPFSESKEELAERSVVLDFVVDFSIVMVVDCEVDRGRFGKEISLQSSVTDPILSVLDDVSGLYQIDTLYIYIVML